MKVLHITNWHPSSYHNKEALWIKAQIDSLQEYYENEIIHFEIFKTNRFNFCKEKSNNLSQYMVELPLENWFLNELIHFIFLIYVFFILRIQKKKDLVNFHIAYPMLTYWHWIKKWVKKPVVITEHWSAYHYNFGVKKSLPRIQRIFQQGVPVITVSKALGQDIKNFASSNFENYIIPNVVDQNIFYMDDAQKRNPFLFMVSQWKSPKTPLVVMQAFLKSNLSSSYTLEIGGYGPLWAEMQSYVKEQKAEDKIKLLGMLDSVHIADKMRSCSAFLHPSDYETFSVVCAEAIACGAFVIAPEIGGIPEVIGDNGLLIKSNSYQAWEQALNEIPISFTSDYDGKFNSETVANAYSTVLEKVIKDFENKR